MHMLRDRVPPPSSATQPKRTRKCEGESGRFLIRIPRSASQSLKSSASTLNNDEIGEIPERTDNKTNDALNDHDWCAAPPNLEVKSLPPIAEESEDFDSGMMGEVDGGEMGEVGGEEGEDLKGSEMIDDKKGPLPLIKSNTDGGIALQYVPAVIDRQERIGCVTYKPFRPLFKLGIEKVDALIDVRIARKYFDKAYNEAIRKRSIWGGIDGVYTDDSDAVCILQHLGNVPSDTTPYVRATFKILSKLSTYSSLDRNGFQSRSWNAHNGLSIRLISARGCNGKARLKRRPQKPTGQCLIKFSSLHLSPVMPYADLLIQPHLQEAINRQSLQLEGHSTTYILSEITNGHYGLCRSDGTILFSDLSWDDLGWTPEGLSIQNTFLNIFGYRWGKNCIE